MRPHQLHRPSVARGSREGSNVVMFYENNFPVAFSLLDNVTAFALAASCVVVSRCCYGPLSRRWTPTTGSPRARLDSASIGLYRSTRRDVGQ
jgi:hypothetical protein